MPPTVRTSWIGASIAALVLVLAPAAHARATWVVHGRGWGHGVGMSAYGAYGYAKHGWSHPRILRHYYPGTRITKVKHPPKVRVLLDARSGDLRFTKARSACGRHLSLKATYRAHRSGRTVRLLSRSGRTLRRCGHRLHATGRGRVHVAGRGDFRGALEAVPTSSGLNVVNQVPVNAYVQGTVPSELPSSWPGATLRAFAIAMRSVALSTNVHGKGFALYSDTRTQLYKGVDAETARTNRAASATRSQVVTYKGAIAQTTYFSSSGGKTESGFLGAPKVPYLRSVDDPYDYYSPLHRWTVRFTQAQMNARLGAYVRGSLRKIRVTKRGDSPRIVTAKLVGSRGTTKIRGDSLQAALGLYSRWAYFKKTSG